MRATSISHLPHKVTQWSLITSEWRTSWRPGMAALSGGAVCFALYNMIASLFVIPLQTEFGWSRGQIAFAYSFGIVSAFLAPFAGEMSDRKGPRALILVGIAGTSICYLLFATLNGSLLYYYAIYFAFNVFGLLVTALTFTRVIVGCFDRTRGLALAFARLGLGACAGILPLILLPIMHAYGTSGGFLLLAGIQLIIALPMAIFWLPKVSPPPIHKQMRTAGGASMLRLIRVNPRIGLLSFAALCNYVPVVTILSQLQPLSVSKGLQPAQSVIVISIIGISSALGALLSGYLVDRFWAPAIAFLLNLLPAAGCLLLMQSDLSPLMIYGVICLIGLGQGVEVDIVAFMISKYFNCENYSSIYGIIVFVIAVGSAVGTMCIGHFYDKYGNYDLAILLCAVSFIMSSISYLAMGDYPARKSNV